MVHGIFKENGDLSSAFEKADSQYEQIFKSRHSRTKAILNNQQPWIQQNNSRTTTRKKHEYILFLRYFFTFTTQKMAMAIPVEVLS